MSVSAQLRGLVSTNVCAVWPLTPPLTGVTERASGNAVSTLEALGDRVRRIGRRDRHRRVGADQPAHAAGVDDDVVADVDAPVVRQRDQVGQRRRVGLVRRVELEQQLAGLVEILLQRVDFGAKKSVFGPATITTDASSGTAPAARARACRPCSSRGRAPSAMAL